MGLFGRRKGGDQKVGFWLRVAVLLVKPVMSLMTRATWLGFENIPLKGGAIFAVNHLSHADPLLMAFYVYDSGRNPSFLGKASIFKIPVLGPIIQATGQIPVYRGTSDAVKSLHAAIGAVRSGQAVIIYPEGTTTRSPDLWPMRGKNGVARLALETGAPVIPIAQWGPQNLYNPITKKMRLRPRTPCVVKAGPAVDLSAWDGVEATASTLNEMTDTIMRAVAGLVGELRGEAPPPLYDPAARKNNKKA
ncbi:1-acyl-sn-glycerol-3-phosphate acyltransferase [Phytomonospora endophytica]|uniref:1-acyl-sn-glycerol-3-phosphate acyltransferase n=2 Tax=Phytomonospora endophytica TaxID=714109 RepID=A0A841FI99_9ACTN|nr:1-acyl-sn-glycerol-3-phosphate acyltransferase [Phytomonospora endophytica]GIG69116.1 1-acyl-sn-glycerol-3-phosphate acyltransferase [Phytomonospora endophytica]